MCKFINRETFFFNDVCPRTLGKVSEVFRGKNSILGELVSGWAQPRIGD